LFVAKFGSNTTPSRPRSPAESTLTLTKGVGSSAPFLMTRRSPLCNATNRRPSGAKVIVVGLGRLPTTCSSTKPVGTMVRALPTVSVPSRSDRGWQAARSTSAVNPFRAKQ
jgi:hypothetical protein